MLPIRGVDGSAQRYVPAERGTPQPSERRTPNPQDTLTLSPKETPKKDSAAQLYNRYGQKADPSGRRAQKERLEKLGQPCQTCATRTYQDGSSDVGVSFKSAAGVAPQAAASAVIAHERQHESNARDTGQEKNANVQTSVRIFTGICPECKQIYVSGGVTNTRISQPKQATDAYQKQLALP